MTPHHIALVIAGVLFAIAALPETQSVRLIGLGLAAMTLALLWA